jgi:cellulose synthase operon protein C
VLSTVAELRNAGDAALVASATLAALRGENLDVSPLGPAAGDPQIDELLAPELVSPTLRSLLKKSGDLLDAAFPLDLRALRASPLPVSARAFSSFLQQLGDAFGLPGLQAFTSPTLGLVCVPVSAAPPQILFGQALLDSSDDAARYFSIIRTLKVLQANAAALSRTPPIDMWPVVAAYLATFDQSVQPPGVDPKKFSDAQRRIQAVPARQFDTDVPLLAVAVLNGIGNRASLLGTALHQWGNRTGMLATGSLSAALRAIAFASGNTDGPPASGIDRLKWIVRNPEARDLATFSVSEQYANARLRLGAGGSS